MRLVICLLVFAMLGGCRQDGALPVANSTIIDVRSQPNWRTELLDDTYTIQFPSDYKGGVGPTIEGPEFSLVNTDQSVYLLGATAFSGVGTPLPIPQPDHIDFANVVLNRVVTLRRDGQTQGVFYYTEQPKTWGRLYLQKGGQLGFSLTIQYNVDRHREVLGILQTIQPR